MKKLIGKEIGRLIVVSKAAKIGNRCAWNCRCICGNEAVILQQSLVKHRPTSSCGCLQKEANLKNLMGERFGDWLVVSSSLRTKKNKDGTSSGAYWVCKCICGIERDVSAESLLSGGSTNCGCARARPICPYGHDTLGWGRAKDGMCKACVKNRNLKREYGITLQDFFDLYDYQKGKCAVCGEVLGDIRPGSPGWDNGVRIEVDHEHDTDLPLKETVRGLLCGGRWKGCNRKLGRIDKGNWLKQASDYIADPPARRMFRK